MAHMDKCTRYVLDYNNEFSNKLYLVSITIAIIITLIAYGVSILTPYRHGVTHDKIINLIGTQWKHYNGKEFCLLMDNELH